MCTICQAFADNKEPFAGQPFRRNIGQGTDIRSPNGHIGPKLGANVITANEEAQQPKLRHFIP